MKILVLSLLRIGDIVLMAPALRGLREANPHAEIHLMINSQFRQIAALLPYVNRIIPFERDRLQHGLGDANVPVFESCERLSELVDELNAVEYDQVINLTQNRLSGWLMSLLQAKSRNGLCFDSHGRATFGSPWFRYLNGQVDFEGREVLHFADVFRFAMGLGDETVPRAALNETVKGRQEADEFVLSIGHQDFIAIQPLTSDAKKDWGFEKFAQAAMQIQRANRTSSFVILGAPFEKDRLQPLMTMLREFGVSAHLAILGFEGVFSLLRKARLLITGDTSVKHLACAARTPVVEISLGSSDIFRTGAYMHGSVIIQSRESCAPCPHSKACHRERHVCADVISPDVVAMVASEVYGRRTFQLRSIAEEYKDAVEIFQVDTKSSGMWAACSVLETLSEESVGRWVDLFCKKIWLENSQSQAFDSMGTEILKLTRLLKKICPEVSDIEWRHLFSDFERQARSVESRINGFKVGLQYLRGCYEDPRRMKEFVYSLISFREKIRHAPLLKSFKLSLDQVIEDDISPAFTRFRRMTDLVIEIERRTEIYLRLIRGLENSNETEAGIDRT